MLTYDRYLLRNFFHVFGVCFITMFGLVVVIDLLENLDDFLLKNGDGGTLGLCRNVLQYYGYQSIFFLDRAGPSLTLIAVITVLILFQRSGELHPLLAAGVPMFRVLSPLVVAGAIVSGALVLNQELVIPRIAFAAHAPRGSLDSNHVDVEPVYDHASRISIDGRRLLPAMRTIEQAEFVLPAPTIASEMTILRAEKAIHRSARKGQPSGWVLQGVTPPFRDLHLTDQGAKIIRPLSQGDAIFVATAVTCDQLYKRGSSYTLLSSQELLRRIHSPAFGAMSVHRLVAHLHTRSVQPFLNVIAVLLVIPLIVRRESPGLVVDSAVCTGILAVNFVVIQACFYLGQARIVPPDLAAWMPVIFSGSLAAWISGWIRT
ncbi:LptF/LptG family permease [bacterium]|nr:LptF/LptG family permease [bacterium]